MWSNKTWSETAWSAEPTPGPANPTRGLVSWAELEAPIAPTRGLISWAELEAPAAPSGSGLRMLMGVGT